MSGLAFIHVKFWAPIFFAISFWFSVHMCASRVSWSRKISPRTEGDTSANKRTDDGTDEELNGTTVQKSTERGDFSFILPGHRSRRSFTLNVYDFNRDSVTPNVGCCSMDVVGPSSRVWRRYLRSLSYWLHGVSVKTLRRHEC